MSDPRIELLQGMSVFGGIRDDIVAFVLDRAPSVAVAHDQFFFREGEPADCMFVLEDGEAVVVKDHAGRERVLRKVQRGDCFGEMSLMDLAPRSASVRAVTDCTALQISAACLFEVYQKDVEQFAMIEMNMGREVSRRLREREAALSVVPPR
jgi:CRP/FNR family transcriptional regulator, cyclic AMP receptor protein